MKAAIYQGIDSIVIDNINTPKPQRGEILIRVDACAVCGSDIRIFHNGNSRVNPPQILGHEIAGTVVEVGECVDKFKIGDRIAVGADIPCGKCFYCESGYGNNCEVNYAMGYQFAGGFAEYCLLNEMVVSYGPVHIIPDNVSSEEAALAEPLACVINGLEIVNVQLGDVVVVIGAGPIGCMMIPMSKMYGASKVIVIDIDGQRLKKAFELGADYIFNSTETDVIEEVKKITNGKGANVIITANGSSTTHIQAIEMAAHRARVNLFGGLASNEIIQIEPNKIHYKEMAIMGSHGSTPRQHKIALDLISAGVINMKNYITHEFSLDDIERAIYTAEKKDGMRVIVRPGGIK